jgi:hypothetical protein
MGSDHPASPGGVAEEVPDEDPGLAGGAELGPVVNDGSVDVELASVGQ